MKIILDCDPGHDDAIALLLAGANKEIEVLGVTTVSGNQTIEKTTQNAINVINYLGLNYKVYAGSSNPIKRERIICEEIHGKSGLDGFDFEEYSQKAEKEDAVSFMIETLLKEEHVTVVTTGPMTNLGSSLLKEPKIKEHIDKIVFMGGSIGVGNVTPAAEFNIYCDPEAADICLKSGIPCYMVGLDVTRQALVLETIIQRMEKLNTKGSLLFSILMREFNKNQKKYFNLDGGPLHDPITIAYLINNDVLHFDYVNMEIDTYNGSSYGRTNCDIPGFMGREKNAYVATKINLELFWNIIEEALKYYK